MFLNKQNYSLDSLQVKMLSVNLFSYVCSGSAPGSCHRTEPAQMSPVFPTRGLGLDAQDIKEHHANQSHWVLGTRELG